MSSDEVPRTPSGRPKRPRLVVTKNKMGWASEQLNDVSREFVEFCRTGFCSDEGSPALDIGAAFGIASIAALRVGASVIAVDLDGDHLAELCARVAADASLPAEASQRLVTKTARFPREIWFSDETLGAVHASNVFHFLTGYQIQRGVEWIARWLRPGGKLFVHASTPWQTPFAPFIAEYERRTAAGETWPGWIPKLSEWSRHKQFGQMPRSIHLLDDRVLRRVAESAGLTVERAWLYRRADLPPTLHMDGRESAGLIAVRPKELRQSIAGAAPDLSSSQ